MKTKTIHLDSIEYSLDADGNVLCLIEDPDYQRKFITDSDGYEYPDPADWPDMVWVNSAYRIGAECMLTAVDDVSPNARRSGLREVFNLRFDCADGVPGNSNRNITRFHGWRGTTNGRSVYAYGLRKIIKIRELKNGVIAVTVGPDLNPDAD